MEAGIFRFKSESRYVGFVQWQYPWPPPKQFQFESETPLKKESMAYKNKEDQVASQRRYYDKNKQKVKEQSKLRRRKIATWFREYKSVLICSHCGYSFAGRPEACDFHHLDPLTKEYTMNSASQASMKALREEIEKCIPLCANCHRIVHSEL